MTAIDRAALIEAAAKVLNPWATRVVQDNADPKSCPFVQSYTLEPEELADAALPVIARELLAPLRELHARNGNPRYGCCATPKVCTDPHQAVCGAPEHGTNKPHWPCPTVRLLDQIESDAKGDER